MKRKSKIFLSLVSLCFSVAVLCFGVYSALSVSYTLSGSVSYELNDLFVEASTNIYRSTSTIPLKYSEGTHSANVSTLETSFTGTQGSYSNLELLSGDTYQDSILTYPDGEVTNPGVEQVENFDVPDLKYGGYSQDTKDGYAFYIVIRVTNLGTETIHATVEKSSSTNTQNTYYKFTDSLQLSAKESGNIVIGLALEDATLNENGTFSFNINFARGELPKEITDMLFTFNEQDKTATLMSYTGTDTKVEIPKAVGATTQTTKILNEEENGGVFADVSALSTYVGSEEFPYLKYAVGDISYTDGGTSKTDKDEVLVLWLQDNSDKQYTDITVTFQDSYTLTTENIMKMIELNGPDSLSYCMFGPFCIFLTQEMISDLNSLESLGVSFIAIFNEVEYSIWGGTGSFLDYSMAIYDILISGFSEFPPVEYRNIIYESKVTNGRDYKVTSIGAILSLTTGAEIPELEPLFSSSVEQISLPNTLTHIACNAFEGTKWLEDNTTEDGSVVVTSSDGSAKYLIKAPDTVTDSNIASCLNGIQVISDLAFGEQGNASVTKIIIPSTLKGIGAGAFSDFSALKEVAFENNSQLESIGDRAFDGCTSLNRVDITDIDAWAMTTFSPYNANPLYYAHNLYLNGELVTEVELTTATKIGSNAFSGCTSLSSITIPNGVTSIGDSAFSGCTSLSTVTFGDKSQLESIGLGTFEGCTSLSSITIPNGVTSIGSITFRKCISLNSITIPNGVTRIGAETFSDCDDLISIEIPASVTSIGSGAFDRCTGLNRVDITDIDAWAMIEFTNEDANPLYYAHNLYLNGGLVTEAKLTTATMIGDSAFSGCTSLTSITIPNGVTSIGDSAFSGCTSLSSITIPSGVTSIGSNAFSGCTSLSKVYIDGQDVASMLTGTSSAGRLLNNITTGEKVYIKSGLSVQASYMTKNFTKRSDTEEVNGVTYDVYVGK